MRRSRTVLDPKYFSNIHTEYEIGGILGEHAVPILTNTFSFPQSVPTSILEVSYVIWFGHLLLSGKGAFGVVRLAVHRMTGERYAVKSISKARLITEIEAEALRREIQILFFLTPHETLAGIKCVFEDQFYVHIVMELCSGGELFEHIISRGTLTEKEAAQFFQQMVEMVGHCHACQVMHRDIKPENFLLSDRSEQARLLACDFGLGTYFQPDKMLTEIVGSPYYVAPEVLRQQYGPQADVWSLGVVLYILLSGVPPFWGPTDKEIFTAVLRGEVSFDCPPWPQISDSAKGTVECCKRLIVF